VRLLAGVMTVATFASPQLHFPRDHFGHRAGVEWWYFTAYVDGSDGHRYSVFFTLFKRAGFVLPVSQVVNLDTGKKVGHSENLVRATGIPFSSKVAGLRYDPARNTWIVRVSTPGYALRFSARPLKQYVLHGGGTGVVPQGTGTSHYYSATRMTSRGSFGGTAFTGTAWFDHQWGDFATTPSAQHWDWFSCRFDDRTELMLYRFRDGHADGTFVDRSGRGRVVGAFDAIAGTRVFRAAGRRWLLDWTVRVPAEHLKLRLHAAVPDQLFHGILVPTFWEGALTASGTKTGICFVEETS
jgi:predicted secreted hydrolase